MALSSRPPPHLLRKLAHWPGGRLLAQAREYFRYHGLLAPLVRLMRDINFRSKIALLALAFSVPAGVLVVSHITDARNHQRDAEAVNALMGRLQQLEGLNAAADGHPSPRGRCLKPHDAVPLAPTQRGKAQDSLALNQALSSWRAECLAELDAHLRASHAQAEERFQWAGLAEIIGVGLALYVLLGFSRVIRGGLSFIQVEVARMAKGDLSSRALARGDDEVAMTVRDLRASLSQLADLFEGVSRGVASVSQAAGEISSASEDLNHRIGSSSEAMSQLQQGISVTLDHLDSHRIHVAEAVTCAQDVAGGASRGRRAMHNLVTVIDGLNVRSREIAQIVTLIDTIAFQTNLLALNASVEAAKAGAAGKSFAVVASEVRALAQRVAEAAQQIRVVVEASTQEIRIGKEIAGSTSEAVQATESNVEEMSGILAKLSQVTLQGEKNAEVMTASLHTVNDSSEKAQHIVTQVAEAGQALRRQSRNLAHQSAKFKLG